MAHGFSCTKEMFLDKYAEVFVKDGFAVLVYDNRNFGDSDGQPRLEVDPYSQIRDYWHAITYVSSLPQVDSSRIGIWGTSYTGGHVLQVAAIDKRVKCVVSAGACGQRLSQCASGDRRGPYARVVGTLRGRPAGPLCRQGAGYGSSRLPRSSPA